MPPGGLAACIIPPVPPRTASLAGVLGAAGIGPHRPVPAPSLPLLHARGPGQGLQPGMEMEGERESRAMQSLRLLAGHARQCMAAMLRGLFWGCF